MFYAETSSGRLRLGDIVTGYVTAIPKQQEPITSSFVNYNIDVALPLHLVVLTPCCSIGEKTLSVVPLESIIEAKRKTFFKNKNYRKDMTLLNLPHLPKDWRELGENVSFDAGDMPLYTYDHLFFYAEDSRLPRYTVKMKSDDAKIEFEARYYLIDFRNICKIKCDCIASEDEGKPNFENLLTKMMSSKILELSIDARSDLRKKIAFYFSRVPKEDQIE
ncbi:MAG: hypothetical protein WBN94_10635 [Methanothrix sp.]